MIAASSDAGETVHQAPPRSPSRASSDTSGRSRSTTTAISRRHDADAEGLDPLADDGPFPRWAGGIDIESYPDLDEFFEDLAQCYRDEIDALYAAGCRYIQLDDTNLAYLCDPVMRQGAVERGDDPDELPRTYAALINAAIDGRPDDLTVGIHLCRGNFRSTHSRAAVTRPWPRSCSTRSTSTRTSWSTTTNVR